MTPELSRPVSTERLPAKLLVTADETELQALARRLAIPAVQGMACRFSLARRGDVVTAEGDLVARVVQTCVVSLELVEQDVHERFTVRFVPAGQEAEDDDPDMPDELIYQGSSIDLGEAAAEQLALALDPYPRHPDAALDAVADDVAIRPFRGLAGSHELD